MILFRGIRIGKQGTGVSGRSVIPFGWQDVCLLQAITNDP